MSEADLKQRRALARQMQAQLERAAAMAEESYSMVFANDPALIKFLLDRLERVEKANSDAYNAIRAIDWAL